MLYFLSKKSIIYIITARADHISVPIPMSSQKCEGDGRCFIQDYSRGRGSDLCYYIKINNVCPCELKKFICICCHKYYGYIPEWLMYMWNGRCLRCDITCRPGTCAYDPKNNLCYYCGEKLPRISNPAGYSAGNSAINYSTSGGRLHEKCRICLQAEKYIFERDFGDDMYV